MNKLIKKIKLKVLYYKLLSEILSDIYFMNLSPNFSKISNGSEIVPRVGAYVILSRLRNIIIECIKTIRNGQLRISQALMKIIIEDTAVAYVHFKDKLQKVTDLDPTKCITKFKSEIQDTGRMYGMVNKISHFNGNLLKDEISIVNIVKNNKSMNSTIKTRIKGVYKNTEMKFLLLFHLYILLHHIYWSLFDLVLRDKESDYKYWKPNEVGALKHQPPQKIFNYISKTFKYYEFLMNKVRL